MLDIGLVISTEKTIQCNTQIKNMTMENNDNQWEDISGISEKDAMRLARELVERIMLPGLRGVPLINRCRDAIMLGAKALRDAEMSVSFIKAFETSLNERSERRSRTLAEIRSFCRRIIRENPTLEQKQLRTISAEFCHDLLTKTFHTQRQYAKARAVLHAIFACGVRHGWCSSNPLDLIPHPRPAEAEISPLPWCDIKKLLRTALKEPYRCCMPAVGLMLWAGIRPAELTRLQWQDIDWQERVICLRPMHSKTGGCRHITLCPALMHWMRRSGIQSSGSICPPNWIRRWAALRRSAGLLQWQQDVLRHTFASYHLKRWHDLPLLQEEMGHRSARLLRTRYLSMRGITREHAKQFWSPGKLPDAR